VARVLLEKIDEMLMDKKEEGLKVAGLKERWVTALFGGVMIWCVCHSLLK